MDDVSYYEYEVPGSQTEGPVITELRTRVAELEVKAEWVARLWRDWPQDRRDGVRLLSEHLHDAIEDLACQFDGRGS